MTVLKNQKPLLCSCNSFSYCLPLGEESSLEGQALPEPTIVCICPRKRPGHCWASWYIKTHQLENSVLCLTLCPTYAQQLRTHHFWLLPEWASFLPRWELKSETFLTVVTSGNSPLHPAKLLVSVPCIRRTTFQSSSENFLGKALSAFLYLHFKILFTLLYRELKDLMFLNFPYLLLFVVHGVHFVHWSFASYIWALGSPHEKCRSNWLCVHILLSPESCILAWMVQLKEEKRKEFY